MTFFWPSIAIPVIRASLFFACRSTILPWLFGEAKHASLDSSSTDSGGYPSSSRATAVVSSLPTPATTSSRNGSGWSVRAVLATFSLAPSLLSISFEEGTLPFVLVLLEAMGINRAALRPHWTASLYGIVTLAVLFIPLGLSTFLTYTLLPESGSSKLARRLIITLVPFALWTLLFLKVPLPSALPAASGYLDAALARTAVIGVALIAVLSGSGAMGAALDSLEAVRSARQGTRRDPTPSDVRAAEASFTRACEDLNRTKAEIERVQSTAEPPSQGGFFGGIDRAFRGSNKHRELKSLNIELSSLSMLASSMRDELDQLRDRKRAAEWNATVGGKIWLAIGHAFAAYCVVRMAVALLSLLFLNYSTSSSSSSPDIISTLLARLLRLFGIDIDVATWSKQISLLFVGVLIIARLRVVLNYLAQFFRAASSGASTSFLLLFLSEVLVIYLLATLIQLRASLPPTFGDAGGDQDPATSTKIQRNAPNIDQPLLATLPDFNIVFGALFDAAFLLSAAASIVIRYFASQNEGIMFNGGR